MPRMWNDCSGDEACRAPERYRTSVETWEMTVARPISYAPVILDEARSSGKRAETSGNGCLVELGGSRAQLVQNADDNANSARQTDL